MTGIGVGKWFRREGDAELLFTKRRLEYRWYIG